MKCKQGDTAKIIYSLRPENVGRIVKVAEHIGRYEAGSLFQYRGMPCQAAITDNYWWIEAEDLSIMLGPSPRAYIPDSWLEPIRPKDKKLTKEQMEDDKFFMDMILG
jgi:hypothetical protein